MDAKPGSKTRRKLIYIPIIHTEADMGSLGGSIRQAAVRKLGKHSWRRKIALIGQLWAQIENVLENLNLSFDKVRLYQDGLPVCGREAEIVTSLAREGSRNHQILFRLMEKGATLTGTESSELLLKEYRRIKQNTGSDPPPNPSGRAELHHATGSRNHDPSMEDAAADLLRERDRYIARRINETLAEGETGILFLGMLHSLEGFLDTNIQVIYPIQKPIRQ